LTGIALIEQENHNPIKYSRQSTRSHPAMSTMATEVHDEPRDIDNVQAEVNRQISTFQLAVGAYKRLDNAGELSSTERTYLPKQQEYMEFCDSVYAHLPEHDEERYLVDFDKIFLFMYYQAHREVRDSTATRKRMRSLAEADSPGPLRFDRQEYDNIVANLDLRMEHTRYQAEEPEYKCMLYSQFNTYRSAIRAIYNSQVTNRVNLIPSWSQIWNNSARALDNHVKLRAGRQKRRNFGEKTNPELHGPELITAIPDIEMEMWKTGLPGLSGSSPTSRTVESGLRNRAMFLGTLKGILRGESMLNAELSDIVCQELPKKESDVHPITVVLLQITFGKVNRDYSIYGRWIRHKDPRFCAISAIAFYLLYRFQYSQEMNHVDFTDNSSWFMIKLLVDSQASGNANEDSMKPNTYVEHIRKIGKELKLPITKFLHLGRQLGAMEGEITEAGHDDIKQLGNWKPSTMDKHYSLKLPMKSMRHYAGFVKADGLHFNPRTVLKPPESLRRELFPWVDDAMKAIDMERAKPTSNNETCSTARSFLMYMDKMRTVILQDAAYILERHPERALHRLFTDVGSKSSYNFGIRCQIISLNTATLH